MADTPDDVNLYNAAEGLTGRGEGIFGDKEEAWALEARRARAAGREPDYSEVPNTAGTFLVTADQVLDRELSNPYTDRAALVRGLVEGDVELVDPVAVIPGENLEVPEEGGEEGEGEGEGENPPENPDESAPAEEEPPSDSSDTVFTGA